MAQGLEQSGNDQGWDDNGHIVILVDYSPKQGLRDKNETEVDESKQCAQGAIDQGSVD